MTLRMVGQGLGVLVWIVLGCFGLIAAMTGEWDVAALDLFLFAGIGWIALDH